MQNLRIALGQINTTVGAFAENRARMLACAREAAGAGAHLLVFPEMTLSGYPPEDLILKPHFIRTAVEEMEALAAELPPSLITLAGFPVPGGLKPRNAAAVICGGKIAFRYAKHELPNYGVFDERRIFEPGERPLCIHIRGHRIGVHICEDSWVADAPHTQALADARLSLLVNLSASPFHCGKYPQRLEVLRRAARRVQAPLAYCNLVGGQDELVFDGGSLILDAAGTVLAAAPRFREAMLLYDLPPGDGGDLPDQEAAEQLDRVFLSPDILNVPPPLPAPAPVPELDRLDEVYEALCLGLRDYTEKNRFQSVLVAISGGIDSALVATLAADALGAGRVHGISLPTRFSSEGTRSDAEALARSLGIPMPMLPIQGLFENCLELLSPLWPGRDTDVTEENLQARIRGAVVMALSNKFNHLVLATGNKSELATGYCTLYGDMCGGFALIKDVPKTMVFDLCRRINERAGHERIPLSTITRPPSAELRDNQKDSDSLPPYDVLDAILAAYVERDLSRDEIVAEGFDPRVVTRVIRLVDGNEYKRRQGAPGVKITPKAFGRDRRMPITHHFVPPWIPPSL